MHATELEFFSCKYIFEWLHAREKEGQRNPKNQKGSNVSVRRTTCGSNRKPNIEDKFNGKLGHTVRGRDRERERERE